jgi:hypothetical protein
MGDTFHRTSPVLYDSAVEEKKTHSVSVRQRRTSFEYVFVSVPVDEHVWERHPDDSKKQRVNAERVMEIAKRMGGDPTVLWARESEPLIEPHPLQVAPPRA